MKNSNSKRQIRQCSKAGVRLQQEMKNLQAIFDSVNIGMLLIAEDGVIKRVNNTMAKWTKKNVASCCGMQVGNIIGCMHAVSSPGGCGNTNYCLSCPIRKAFELVLHTGRPVSDLETETIVSVDGKNIPLWLQINVNPIYLEGMRHAVLTINNITAIKEAEKELRRQEAEKNKRLADIGTLAATVAHELRNPLASIKLAVFNIKRKADNNRINSQIASINSKLAESEQIIDNLLFYSKIKVSHPKNINVANILKASIKEVLKQRLKGDLLITQELTPIEGLIIEADPLQIREVFINIINNAFDAVAKNKGRIEIKALLEPSQLRISFKDNGEGIEQGHLERVFDPFFTTKAKGTGLGLAVCKQIISLHHGSIALMSKPGQGTTVNIILPITKKNDK